LTYISQNRCATQLREENLVVLRNGWLNILNWPELAKISEFDPLYLDLRDGQLVAVILGQPDGLELDIHLAKQVRDRLACRDHSLCALTPVMLAFIPHEAIRDLTTGYPGIAATLGDSRPTRRPRA
jgi:hypothetical protein